jgi:hypothetical protein
MFTVRTSAQAPHVPFYSLARRIAANIAKLPEAA